MICEILRMGDSRLLNFSKPVEKFNQDLNLLINDMLDTMHNSNGVGLAAPQIGVSKQVIIFKLSDKNNEINNTSLVEVLINPIIRYSSTQEESLEGCLSIPGLYGVVNRFSQIEYEGFNQYGKKINRIAKGFQSFIIQHEYDHLIGKLYPMRITDFSKFGFSDILFSNTN